MQQEASQQRPLDVVMRLQAAINAHDLERLVACFADGFVNETPAHPDRGFRGADQVRRNWTQILAGVPDLSSRLVSSTVAGETVWAEWDWSGTRRDGAPHRMRGVTITEVRSGLITGVRFFMEPMSVDGAGVDAAVRHTVSGDGHAGPSTGAVPVAGAIV